MELILKCSEKAPALIEELAKTLKIELAEAGKDEHKEYDPEFVKR